MMCEKTTRVLKEIKGNYIRLVKLALSSISFEEMDNVGYRVSPTTLTSPFVQQENVNVCAACYKYRYFASFI